MFNDSFKDFYREFYANNNPTNCKKNIVRITSECLDLVNTTYYDYSDMSPNNVKLLEAKRILTNKCRDIQLQKRIKGSDIKKFVKALDTFYTFYK